VTTMHLADAGGSPREWRGGAGCLNHDPGLFFPEGTAGPALRQVDQARQVCRSCPVLNDVTARQVTREQTERIGATMGGSWHFGIAGTDADRLPDEVLLAGLGTGDVDLAVTFVHRFQRAVFGIAMTVTGDPGTAEEVAQQTFEWAWRHAQVYDSRQGPVRAWMTTIARNLAVDVIHARPSAPVAPAGLSGLLAGMTDPSEQPAGAHGGAAVLRRTLAGLPATQARAVAMAGIYGMTARQIARAEGIPLDTARTRIRDGMQALQATRLLEDAGGN
jgi:RNA polymerase sigma factor (sigma-70 family)